MLVNSIKSLKQSSHLRTRLELRDEKAHAYRLIPWLALVNVSFGVVDCLVAPDGVYINYFLIRIAAVLASRYGFILTRGRARYGFRLLLTVTPYMYGVEYIMLTRGLLLTPYFAGMALVMVTSAMLFPVRTRVSAAVYTISVLPVFIWLYLSPLPSALDTMNVIMMTLGTVYVCSVNSGQVNKDLVARLIAKEALSRSIGSREKEVRAKANELLKRKVFESQFSPQVIQAVITDPALIKDMHRHDLVTLVIDIEESTRKASSLAPHKYKEVVEEVFDLFAAACLKWDVTLDKFTGDGVQAFAGAPVPRRDDFTRVMNTCFDFTQLVRSRKDVLELLWEGPLNVRMAVCRGQALVGFVGKGVFKSYTAIGDMVSFTHRIASAAQPWCVAAYDWEGQARWLEPQPQFISQELSVVGLKGFAGREFKLLVYKPREEAASADLGRCKICSTPMVMEDGRNGLPRVFCPACKVNSSPRAIAA